MRLDPVLDALYALGTLWGAAASSQVCPAGPQIPVSSTFEAAWSSGPAAAGVTAFVDVRVVPMDSERVLPNHTVLVEGGRITALGPSAQVRVPAGALRIDGRGKYLMPGLGDMHVHFPPRRYEVAVREQFTHLANGVTTILQTSGMPVEFLPLMRHYATQVPGPRIYFGPMMRVPMDSLNQVGAYVAAHKAQGYHTIPAAFFIVMSGGTLVGLNDIYKSAAAESLGAAAHRMGLPIDGHTHTPITKILALRPNSYHHMAGMERLSQDSIGRIAAVFKRAGTWLVPTLNCHESHGYNAGPILKTLHEAGVGVLLSGDADVMTGSRNSPSVVQNELSAFVRAGLTPYQTLLTGTRNVAQFLGVQDSTGTVAVGKRADLVLLSGNPLQSVQFLREPAGVMVQGRWFDRAALDAGLIDPPPPPPVDERLLFPPEVAPLVKLQLVSPPQVPRPRPRPWLVLEIEQGGLRSNTKERNEKLAPHLARFEALADSLTALPPSDRVAYGRVLEQQAAALGAMRAVLVPIAAEQHEKFDQDVRIWLRVQARKGYRLTVTGVAPVPTP